MSPAITMNPDLKTLAGWMTGQFDNLAQSQRDPAWFVALRLWCRSLPPAANTALNAVAGTQDAIGLFVEQAPLPAGDRPYRQRLFLLCPPDVSGSPNDSVKPSELSVWYFGFQNPSAYAGAGADREPARLATLDRGAIQTLTNARLPLRRCGDRFVSRAAPEQICTFHYGDRQGHVRLGFEVTARQWLSFDQGIDSATGKPLWGALMGPYELQKSEVR